ncbi:UbiA family prenyltransferase [Nocardia camponoti]|uniref:Ubiquinone biosynthesis protein UbiA n=1 Tax=Nocardia camponoti TaxID=1616106 RepID=A0A917QQI6_9NOCA|nr:UbiA family prenyltransferase [Nocardia camponoti]GGK63082.1 ubiquinone biosynthesis protein UbiA [Nocardia camponoti]
MVPATLFTTAAWGYDGADVSRLPVLLAAAVVYFALYIYTFDLSNQLTGIEEDRLNKPHRPLVTGLVTPAGARTRLIVATVAFLVTGAATGVLEWALLWTAAWYFHNHMGGARRLWGKNLAMTAGTIAQLSAAWQLVTPLDSTAWRWILVIAVPLTLLVSLQDFRDLHGDHANRRRTLVMILGEPASRALMCACFAVYPALLYVVLYRHADLATTLCAIVVAILSEAIAVRILRLSGRRADNRTYVLYTLCYCVILASAIPALWHGG